MFKSSELGDELQALKSEMSRLLDTPARRHVRRREEPQPRRSPSRSRTALNELGETLSAEEEHVEKTDR